MDSPTASSVSPQNTDRYTNGLKSVPLVAHIIHKLDVGGLENGLINLINSIPRERYRHAIICLTEYTDFRSRIRREDVNIYALHKQPGKDPGLYWRLWRLLRQLRPAIIHTRNIGTMDCQVPAALSCRAYRVHGEHGRDVIDIDGTNPKYLKLRKIMRPLIHRYISVSRELEIWLRDKVGVPGDKIERIYNGVDVETFRPAGDRREPLVLPDFFTSGTIIVGTVGRLQAVKDQVTLASAFVCLMKSAPDLRERLRLVIIGDGPLLGQVREILHAADVQQFVWLPGSRTDVPSLLGGMDLFVLPSLAEGVSNTVLEAMACGLPVVATRVGGTPEIVREGVTGQLVPSGDPEAMAQAMLPYLRDPDLRRRHGSAAREHVCEHFTIERMTQRYVNVYDSLLSH